MAQQIKDEFTRKWIIANSLEEIQNYLKGELTIRGLHYRLVARGMTNSMRHYKRVVAAMTQARWDGLVDFDTFSDNDRDVIGETRYKETDVKTGIEAAKVQIKLWMKNWYKNRWENQEHYVEIFIEKKALIGVFQKVCDQNRVALSACKGYPSLTFLDEARVRFSEAKRQGKKPIILYFGDYDPSGEDIPRSIQENLKDLGCYVELERILLMEHQVIEMKLPPAPAKKTDTRNVNWDGLGQVELDAVEPRTIRKILQGAIDKYFDEDLHEQLMETQEKEQKKYQKKLKKFVTKL